MIEAYGQKFDSWCEICLVKWKGDGCNGCQPNATDPVQNKPSKFYYPMEGRKMIITVIGSIKSSKETMLAIKKYFERFGHEVNIPCVEEREKIPLICLCESWINKIEEADLVVAIPKEVHLSNEKSRFVYTFGESTTYEMAIASRFGKQIMHWVN